ncbi:MAG: ATPase domain-containing protein [Betaproteobacteria bacterium]|jgi:circadian clock protein KaiC
MNTPQDTAGRAEPTGKVGIRLLTTGVPGLDDVLQGGLPQYSLNLILGPPGSGKTTLAQQMMFHLARPDAQALYFAAVGEPLLKMLRYQQQFDFFNVTQVNQSVHFMSLEESTLEGGLDNVLEQIAQAVAQRQPAYVFVDSFRSLVLASQASTQPVQVFQRFIHQLCAMMTSWHATTFLITESNNDLDEGPRPALTVADGLLHLQQSVQRNSVVRKLSIIKMRGQATVPGLHTFRMDKSGLRVFPPANCGLDALPPAELGAGTRLRLASGVPGLDDMLGGGLPQGCSVLVAGPSGSGKSILAAQFLAAGADAGEHGVLVAFEQHPDEWRIPKLAGLIEAGQVSMVEARSVDLSIDEIVMQLLEEIRRTQARRVVIDSLSGFELSLAPTFRDDFRESMLRLVTALARAGVTVLMTCELEDRYTDLRFSPYGTAFLTDAIIVQRYIEVDSRLQRVMAVVKLRGSMHSNELRLFSIDASGIRVGERVKGQEGLLGGRPTRRSAAEEPWPQHAPALDPL